MVKKSPLPLCSGKCLTAKYHLSSYDLDKTHGFPICLPMTRPDTVPSNSHSSSHKYLAELLVPIDQWEQNTC